MRILIINQQLSVYRKDCQSRIPSLEERNSISYGPCDRSPEKRGFEVKAKRPLTDRRSLNRQAETLYRLEDSRMDGGSMIILKYVLQESNGSNNKNGPQNGHVHNTIFLPS